MGSPWPTEFTDELSREQHAADMAAADSWHPARMRDLHLGYASSSRRKFAVVVPPTSTKPRRRQRAASKLVVIALALGWIATITLTS